MDLNGIPGLSIAVVEDGRIAGLRAYGLASVDTDARMRVETPVELASVSKSMTALAVVILEREGLIRREASVTETLPELGAGWSGVTLRDLLRHRSGLRRRNDFLVPCCGPAAIAGLDRTGERMAAAELASPPGETYSYSNANYVLLASVVQRASGVPFADYMDEKVFEPTGMRTATVEVAQAAEHGLADRHERQWGSVQVSPSAFVGWYGSSRVKASAADMGAFLESLQDPELKRLGTLSPEGAWWERLETEYDLGWSVQLEAGWLGGELALEHTGKIWGGSTAVVMVPRRRAAVAVLANTGCECAGRMARSILAARVDDAPLQPRGPSRAEDPDTWAQVFVVVSAVLFASMLSYGIRFGREIRAGTRHRRTTGPRLVRATILVGLAAKLVHSVGWATAPPPAALPTTIRVALPLLASTVAALLALAAGAGLFPRSKS